MSDLRKLLKKRLKNRVTLDRPHSPIPLKKTATLHNKVMLDGPPHSPITLKKMTTLQSMITLCRPHSPIMLALKILRRLGALRVKQILLLLTFKCNFNELFQKHLLYFRLSCYLFFVSFMPCTMIPCI